jgi:glycosyltransferase involved in cell wall biosynthesis
MNILFLIHRYPPAVGGSERFVQEMARRLGVEGQQTTVYTSDLREIEGFWQRGAERLAAGPEERDGVKVHRFPARVLPLHGMVSRLAGLIPWAPIGMTLAPPGMILPGLWQAVRAGGRFDLVHASAYPALMYLGAVAARRSGAKLVLMPCTHPGVGRAVSRQIARLYCQADTLIALTERERQTLISAGVAAERIGVTGAGIDPEATLGADGDRFRQGFGLSPTAPVVAFVGHKTPGKGALHLLDVCETLLAERADLTVAMVGPTTEAFARRYQSLPGSMRERVLDLYLSDEEKHDLLAASSVLVLPSQHDSFGIVLLEAWLHGKPVVGARAGGIPDVIEESRSGLLVPFGDVPALAQAIAWVLDHPGAAAQMGDYGRERTLQRWTWDAVYERVMVVYEGCWRE